MPWGWVLSSDNQSFCFVHHPVANPRLMTSSPHGHEDGVQNKNTVCYR